jgi:hypothetical protein
MHERLRRAWRLDPRAHTQTGSASAGAVQRGGGKNRDCLAYVLMMKAT